MDNWSDSLGHWLWEKRSLLRAALITLWLGMLLVLLLRDRLSIPTYAPWVLLPVLLIVSIAWHFLKSEEHQWTVLEQLFSFVSLTASVVLSLRAFGEWVEEQSWRLVFSVVLSIFYFGLLAWGVWEHDKQRAKARQAAQPLQSANLPETIERNPRKAFKVPTLHLAARWWAFWEQPTGTLLRKALFMAWASLTLLALFNFSEQGLTMPPPLPAVLPYATTLLGLTWIFSRNKLWDLLVLVVWTNIFAVLALSPFARQVEGLATCIFILGFLFVLISGLVVVFRYVEAN